MLTLYKGTPQYILGVLFSIFDFNKRSFISIDDVLFMLNHLPVVCPRCGESVSPAFDFKEEAVKMFATSKFMNLDSFIESYDKDPEIPKLFLNSLLNGAPFVLDDCMGYNSEVTHFPVEELKYQGKKYHFQLRDQSIYYSSNSDVENPKGMILLNDLHVEASEGFNFILRNGKFFYEFSAKSKPNRDSWVENIRTTTKYRDFNAEYTFVQSLGRGAYGDVQLCTNQSGQQVAVKNIRKEPLEAKAEMRIRREVAILKMVKHKNIALLIDYFERPLELFIVIEYVNGPNLFQWLQSKNFQIPEESARKIIFRVAQSLQYLHGLGIIHRDIKLENIIIDETNGVINSIKLVDFGLSCILGPGQTSQEPVGTLKYASPEVISRLNYRETVDAWGLGVVTYICLIGRMPFFGKNDNEVATRIIKKSIEFDNEKWLRVSNEGKTVVRRLLTKKMDDRMTISELLSSDWLADELNEVPNER